jgi:putative addiction module component (TIGR02574 family)
MPASLDQLESDAMLLNEHDRADLVERLVESLASQTDNQVQQAWLQVALRRRDEIRSGQVAAIPGPEGLAMVRSLVGR